MLHKISEYSYKYIHLVAKLSKIIFQFYKKEHEQLKYHELMKLSKETFSDIEITEDEIKVVAG